MARNTQPVTSDYDYNVVMDDFFVPDGSGNFKKTSWKCTRRTDTGAVIAPVTKDYGIVQNSDIIPRVRDAFAASSLGEYKEDIRVVRGGARMYARYDFTDHSIKIPKVGDDLGLRLTVNNSFDRSSKVSFSVGAVRLVCTNGMTAVEKEYSLTKKHSSKINLDFIKDALSGAMDSFNSLTSEDNIYTVMASREISQDQGLFILQNLVKKKVISEVTREGIAQVWNAPTHNEDSDRSIYNLLNASTEYLTHRVEGDRFELANRVTTNVTRQLTKAARQSNIFDGLVKAPDAEAVVVASN